MSIASTSTAMTRTTRVTASNAPFSSDRAVAGLNALPPSVLEIQEVRPRELVSR